MSTLGALAMALKRSMDPHKGYPALSENDYDAGFRTLTADDTYAAYEAFILPQLRAVFDETLGDHELSVLEIGPGRRSVLEKLPLHMRLRIGSYTALEPNSQYAKGLQDRVRNAKNGDERPFLHARLRARVINAHYGPPNTLDELRDMLDGPRYDLVLFCHSMYGMDSKLEATTAALGLLNEPLKRGVVVIFHRDPLVGLDGLTSTTTAAFPTGTVTIPDDDEAVDRLTSFLVGKSADCLETKLRWRQLCRRSARPELIRGRKLILDSPEIMLVFNRGALASRLLNDILAHSSRDRTVKNHIARRNLAVSSIIEPKTIQDIQNCISWARNHDQKLTVLGGGHSDHGLWPHTVAIDMKYFAEIDFIPHTGPTHGIRSHDYAKVVVGAGCRAGDIIRALVAIGQTLPIGARPSTGAGLWLQGGLGHTMRFRGLTCDSIVGVVLVSADDGQIVCVGDVPSSHCPPSAKISDSHDDLLWAIRGAGTNFGIVVNVVFKTSPDTLHSACSWQVPLENSSAWPDIFRRFDYDVAKRMSRRSSIDAYCYWEDGVPHFGAVMLECSSGASLHNKPVQSIMATDVLGPCSAPRSLDSLELFDADLYMSSLRGGHAGKTSSFKRCVFLKDVGDRRVSQALESAMIKCPTPLCYMHLLQGGGAVSDTAVSDTAFGLRDWDFACVITGIWPRDMNDGTEALVQSWVYSTVEQLLPLATGVYSADLGPDPRDGPLARAAFGTNLSRLAMMKQKLDPANILAYTCPLLPPNTGPRIVVLVTGKSCVGKDYCADCWVDFLRSENRHAMRFSISDATKREYASATGADFDRLTLDRQYKELHRPALAMFWEAQKEANPELPKHHFLSGIREGANCDVLFITGMREEDPVATYASLVPEAKVIEVKIEATEGLRLARKMSRELPLPPKSGAPEPNSSHPRETCRVFQNVEAGAEAAGSFARQYIVPLCDNRFEHLASMIRTISNHPRDDVHFRHVLDIAQHRGGLGLATSLIKGTLIREWSTIDRIIACEAGGYVFAAPVAAQLDIPLALVRKAGKLPPPTISAKKGSSHISSVKSGSSCEEMVELEVTRVSPTDSVVIIDDVLASGRTLCGILTLLVSAHIPMCSIKVLVIAEFPEHRGREWLRSMGFGAVAVRSLLVCPGM